MFSFDLFKKNSSDVVLESQLHPDVLEYIQNNQLYMYSIESVGKRNRSRFYIFIQCMVMASVIMKDACNKYFN